MLSAWPRSARLCAALRAGQRLHLSRRHLSSSSGPGRLYWPDPWGRARAGEPHLIDESDVDFWRLAHTADPSQEDKWIRFVLRDPAYVCPACGTPFAQWKHLLRHWELTGHARLPAGLGIAHIQREWHVKQKPIHRIALGERVPRILLLPYGASQGWLRPLETLLSTAQASTQSITEYN